MNIPKNFPFALVLPLPLNYIKPFCSTPVNRRDIAKNWMDNIIIKKGLKKTYTET